MRLVSAVLAEQTDARAEGRRYPGLGVLARCYLGIAPEFGSDVRTESLPAPTA